MWLIPIDVANGKCIYAIATQFFPSLSSISTFFPHAPTTHRFSFSLNEVLLKWQLVQFRYVTHATNVFYLVLFANTKNWTTIHRARINPLNVTPIKWHYLVRVIWLCTLCSFAKCFFSFYFVFNLLCCCKHRTHREMCYMRKHSMGMLHAIHCDLCLI